MFIAQEKKTEIHNTTYVFSWQLETLAIWKMFTFRKKKVLKAASKDRKKKKKPVESNINSTG